MTDQISMVDPQLQRRCDVARSHLFAGRHSEAERIYREVLAKAPDFALAWHGLGYLSYTIGAYPEAVEYLRRALVNDPSTPDALTFLGLALRQVGDDDRALESFREGVRQHPRDAMAHYWLGLNLFERGERAGALASLDAAMALNPGLIGPFGVSLYNFLENCEWRGWDRLLAFMNEALDSPHPLFSPLNLMMVSESSADIQRCARALANTYFPAQKPLCTGPYPRGDKIKIAFMSTDLNDHPVGHLLAGVLEAFDRQAFDLTAIHFGPANPSDIRDRLVAAFDTWLDLEGLSEEAMARTIAEHKIDIAVTLNGYTTHCLPEVFARKPAPVLVNFLGFPGTMGAPYIDYIIADPYVIPKDQAAFYDEKIVWMPNSYQPTDDKAPIAAETPTRASQGLPEDAFVFMGYNRGHKISPTIFVSWMKILERVPGSVLWLQDPGATARDNLRREIASCGLAPERLVFAARNLSRPEHVARHRLADLFLDTLPYNAHSTASDALWAGLPVLTCPGSTFPGRVCASLVSAAGFAELITDNLKDYEDLAVALAKDKPRLAALRARLVRDAPQSPLFATAAWTRHLEQAFRTMYETSQAGRTAESFAVSPAS